MRASLPPRDWSVPLFPRVVPRAVRAREHVGPLTPEEWVQMRFADDACTAMELAESTHKRYAAYVREFSAFLNRYPASERERLVFPLLHPRVFSPTKTEAILLDFVRYEVGGRGNGYSTCNGKLAGIRYFGIKHGIGDITKGHLRLDYFMRGLKKLRGPPQKKKGVTRAMMLAMRSVLDLTDPDDCVVWCSLLFAFHFMCRSAEYCAKGTGGSFFLDEVVLMSNVSFFRDGVRLPSDFHHADEVRATFGATKRGGGETRSVWRAYGPLCLVSALADLLEFEPRRRSDIPLFSWFAGSTRTGAGVRYYDIMKIIKQAAVLLGDDAKSYGSHSIRRGAATCYL